MTNLFNYIDRPSVIHRMTGASKLLCMLLWCLAVMTTFYTPLLLIMALAGVLLFPISKIRVKDVQIMLIGAVAFMILNNLLIYLFSPEHGVTLYGSRHVLCHIAGRYTVTLEQLLYHANLLLKYTASIPIILLFVCTTNPSEFAASLSKIGVSYKVSYAVSLSLRYIPDIQREFHEINQAQQARGVEMSKKANVIDRLKAASSILIPLVLLSIDRIETISNAMELRGFGKNKKRSWYRERAFTKMDFVAVAVGIVLFVVSIAISIANGSRFYNPWA